jgi:hypothetical protein
MGLYRLGMFLLFSCSLLLLKTETGGRSLQISGPVRFQRVHFDFGANNSNNLRRGSLGSMFGGYGLLGLMHQLHCDDQRLLQLYCRL